MKNTGFFSDYLIETTKGKKPINTLKPSDLLVGIDQQPNKIDLIWFNYKEENIPFVNDIYGQNMQILLLNTKTNKKCFFPIEEIKNLKTDILEIVKTNQRTEKIEKTGTIYHKGVLHFVRPVSDVVIVNDTCLKIHQ